MDIPAGVATAGMIDEVSRLLQASIDVGVEGAMVAGAKDAVIAALRIDNGFGSPPSIEVGVDDGVGVGATRINLSSGRSGCGPVMLGESNTASEKVRV